MRALVKEQELQQQNTSQMRIHLKSLQLQGVGKQLGSLSMFSGYVLSSLDRNAMEEFDIALFLIVILPES